MDTVLIVRAWSRTVSSVALWLKRPPEAQLARVLRYGRVSVEVERWLERVLMAASLEDVFAD